MILLGVERFEIDESDSKVRSLLSDFYEEEWCSKMYKLLTRQKSMVENTGTK